MTRSCAALALGLLLAAHAQSQPIDRKALVDRHNPVIERYAPESPLSVGNGEFAFTFDVTGLQTFPCDDPGCLPLGTMAQWGWHKFPGSEKYRYEQTLHDYPAHGRMVSYSTDMRTEPAQAIRSNPHKFNLGQIGLRLLREDGARATAEDLKSPTQELNLWTGEAVSRFEFDGQPVTVRTVGHPTLDAVAVMVKSPLVESGRVAVELRFAYPLGAWGPKADVWDQPEKHTSDLAPHSRGVCIARRLDETEYYVDVTTDAKVDASEATHTFVFGEGGGDRVEAAFRFHRDTPSQALSYAEVAKASAEHWTKFWSTGGAIDLSGSSDPRWRELERRLVLSQYVTAVNCSGSMPPQETGLVCNSWHGKAHLEMHWWHAAHFQQWDRFELTERSLGWYDDILPAAKRIAERQGYAGVRWPKMTGPHGVSSPSSVGELLIWQQPHPIYFAEQAYRQSPTPATLERYREIVEQTAAFMASYAHYDQEADRYVLGPVLIPAQECYEGLSKEGVYNPTYELAYWRWALRVANEWRGRLGLEADAKWADVAEKIARPSIRDGVYTAIENPPYTRRHDHPSMLCALGVLPDVGLIDRDTMRRTMLDVDADWDWATTWGWDYPVMAMTAARLGDGAKAIDYLLLDSPKNGYLPNGHCYQADRLPIYLPANGGLLSAAALMAAGWDELPDDAPNAPGFPQDGSWTVRHEGLKRGP